MNEALKKTDKYQKRYMKKHRMLCVCLDKERDEDIIEWMNEQPCITASVKRILRWEINGRDDYENEPTVRETPAGDQKQDHKTCATCQFSRIDYRRMEGRCSNEESEKGGSQITPKDTCGAWR